MRPLRTIPACRAVKVKSLLLNEMSICPFGTRTKTAIMKLSSKVSSFSSNGQTTLQRSRRRTWKQNLNNSSEFSLKQAKSCLTPPLSLIDPCESTTQSGKCAKNGIIVTVLDHLHAKREHILDDCTYIRIFPFPSMEILGRKKYSNGLWDAACRPVAAKQCKLQGNRLLCSSICSFQSAPAWTQKYAGYSWRHVRMLSSSSSRDPVPQVGGGGNEDKSSSNDAQVLAQALVRQGNSILSAFFHETSPRQKRRQARLERQKRRAAKNKAAPSSDNPEEPWVDRRTVTEILFPRPLDADQPKESEKPKQRKSLKFYWRAWKKAWAMYKSTWEGFWTSGMIVEDTPTEKQKEAKDATKSKTKQDDPEGNDEAEEDERRMTVADAKRRVRQNVRRNTRVVQKTAFALRDKIREQTGIHSADDLRRVAAELMTLLAECLKEFLAGYREGRDGQVRKMLEEDLRQQQIEQAKAAAAKAREDGAGGDDEEEENKSTRKRRRRTKRRVIQRR